MEEIRPLGAPGRALKDTFKAGSFAMCARFLNVQLGNIEATVQPSQMQAASTVIQSPLSQYLLPRAVPRQATTVSGHVTPVTSGLARSARLVLYRSVQ